MISAHRRSITSILVLALAFGLIACSDSSGTPKLRILVTNDDGFDAEGIDAIVEALIADLNNEVVVCAPNGNRSGSGSMTGPSDRCGDGQTTKETETKSGYPAVSIDGCPADAVNYAVDNLYPANAPPHVVISGINEGQNVSEGIATMLSGTVGAAKTAARDHDIPALASSQGSSVGAPVPPPNAEYDYDSGVEAVLDWLAEHRAALAAGTVTTDEVDSINIPTCTAGEIRGVVEVPLAADGTGAFDPQNCESDLVDPETDVEAFTNGYTALSPVPAN